MPNFTTTYQLEKPLDNDFYDIQVQNRNMDKIDAAVAATSQALASAQEGLGKKADKKPPAAAGNFAGLDDAGNLTDTGKKPGDFSSVSHSHSYSEIAGKPTSFPPATHSHAYGDITGKPSAFTPSTHKSTHATGGTDALAPGDIGAAAAGHSHAWGGITGKPATFAPSAHKASHVAGGADAITPGEIGAATASHTHAPSAIQQDANNRFVTDAEKTAWNGKANAGHTHDAGSIASGTLPVERGGTGNTAGNAATATKLATARTVRTNLASTATASFDGSANITPGVTGTLPLANGGTGATTAAAALTKLGAAPAYTYSLSDLTAGSSSLTTGKLYFVYE